MFQNTKLGQMVLFHWMGKKNVQCNAKMELYCKNYNSVVPTSGAQKTLSSGYPPSVC